MRRNDVPTPALLVDIDLLDSNISAMCSAAKSMGVALRPHAKVHKCIEIAHRLMAAGAIGASCSTIGEAEVMALGGVKGILLTAPITTPEALKRLQQLLLRGADVMVVIDHPASVNALAAVATSVDRILPILVDVDVGYGRTGSSSVADVVTLARSVSETSALRIDGIQTYWGNLQQVIPFAERQRLIALQLKKVEDVITALGGAGLKPRIVSGGGTGSHRIDGSSGLFTELQPGSFLFMDSCYGIINTSENENPYVASLFVAATVVSTNRPNCVIVNAGWKALAADSGKPRVLRGAPLESTFRFMGDEHGAIDFPGAHGLQNGDVVELLTSHCDPTVNLYSKFHVVRGEYVIDVWPIRARY